MKSTAMLVAALVALAAVSCSKEEAPESKQEDIINTIILSIEQPANESATKTTLGEKSANHYPVNWSESDAVAVSEQSGCSCVQYTLSTGAGSTTGNFTTSGTAPSGAVYAYYPYANVTGVNSSTYAVTIPDVQRYAANSFGNGAMPMYASASSASDLSSMSPIMSVLKISLTGSCIVKSILLQSASINLSGEATVDMASGIVSITEATGKKYVLLVCGDGVQLSDAATTFHIVIPATADKVTDFTVTIKDDKGYLMQKKLSTSSKFTAKTIKNVNSALTVTTSSILPGKFTVDSTSKQVQFTTANLYWNGSAYAFETAQTAYPTSWSTDHIGHFYWSKTASVAYAETYSDNGASKDDSFFFGIGNSLAVDGQSGLYALTGNTTGEWYYLICKRANASSLYKRLVTIATSAGTAANCVVIAPDNWDYTKNPLQASYDTAAWADAESAGLVCLPPAGRRRGNPNNLEYVGSNGYYWSATPVDYSVDHDEVDRAWGMYFMSSGKFNTLLDTFRAYGNSVRLVTSVK